MNVNRRTALFGALALLPMGARAQGFAGLGSDATGFALPAPDPVFRFPGDHGAHPDFRIEWWYVTATLDGSDGAQYGIQWTLFRSALVPGARPGWASRQVWFAHAGLTTAARHFVSETYARGGIGQAGVTPDPFSAWIDDWHMTSRAPRDRDALDRLDLTATGPEFSYRLMLEADGPLALQGRGGYSKKSDSGQASYYYAQPHYRVTGQLDLPGGPVSVTGRGWLDREWSSQPLQDGQDGWDWFALHLDSGAKLMVGRVRDTGGAGFTAGNWIGPDGSNTYLADGEIALDPQIFTRIDGRDIPTGWRIRIASRGLDITTTPLNPQAWMGTMLAYWEGPIAASGSHAGRGYLEMTGYE